MKVPYKPGLNTTIPCPWCQARVPLPKHEPVPDAPEDAEPFGTLVAFVCPRCGETIDLEPIR